MGKLKINLMTSLKDLAIQKALENQWVEAIDVNLEILTQNEHDIDTLNRLAYAYLKSSNLTLAKDTYTKVLSIDKTNPIALKNIKKIDALSTQGGKSSNQSHVNHLMENVFIQEAGKTKTVELSNLADKKTLISLQHGDEVLLTIKRSKLFVLTTEKTYIGMLPDNVGIRLISFIKGGNEYIGCIKSIEDKSVTIFIKEVKRAKKFSNQSSFT